MVKLLEHPSFYAHALNGILALVALIIIFMNYNKIKTLDPHFVIILILLFSITIGIHGLSHFYLERHLGYNPLAQNIEKK